jgi:hypothetical protein
VREVAVRHSTVALTVVALFLLRIESSIGNVLCESSRQHRVTRLKALVPVPQRAYSNQHTIMNQPSTNYAYLCLTLSPQSIVQ